jgi:putative chitinase
MDKLLRIIFTIICSLSTIGVVNSGQVFWTELVQKKDALEMFILNNVDSKYSESLICELRKNGMTDKHVVCAFVAQIKHEGLDCQSENLNYSAERLVQIGWFKTIEQARPFAHNPVKLGDKVYGNHKWRGRGAIGITGKQLYGICGSALKLDLKNNPDLLLIPENSIRSAIWFYKWKQLHLETDINRISRGINRGNVNSKKKAMNENKRRETYLKLLKAWKQ